MRVQAARLLRPDGSLRPGAVVVEDGRVVAIEPLGGGAPEVDLLSPGLVDLQVNGWGPHDVWRDPDLTALGSALAAAGTTAWCPTLVSRPLDRYPGWFASHTMPGPGDVGVHLEGPFLTHPGAHDPDVLGPPDPAWLDALPERVRIVTLAPELPGALDAIRRLAGRRVVVSLGHSDADYADAEAAAAAGARMVTHVFNAMRPLRHRDPGLAGAALTDDRLVPAVIADGVHVDPAVVKLVLVGRRAVLVSDSVAWDRDGLVVAGGAARRQDGTLAGSVITMADAVRASVRAGVDLATALVAATATPAALLGLADRGVLAPGARADLVALDEGLAVTHVWVGGEPVRR